MDPNQIINSIGALSEMIGVMYKSLINQGISTTEAILLIRNILPVLMNKNQQIEEDQDD